jgi:hypothetical protein
VWQIGVVELIENEISPRPDPGIDRNPLRVLSSRNLGDMSIQAAYSACGMAIAATAVRHYLARL